MTINAAHLAEAIVAMEKAREMLVANSKAGTPWLDVVRDLSMAQARFKESLGDLSVEVEGEMAVI